jgi:hypothetical protein
MDEGQSRLRAWIVIHGVGFGEPGDGAQPPSTPICAEQDWEKSHTLSGGGYSSKPAPGSMSLARLCSPWEHRTHRPLQMLCPPRGGLAQAHLCHPGNSGEDACIAGNTNLAFAGAAGHANEIHNARGNSGLISLHYNAEETWLKF